MFKRLFYMPLRSTLPRLRHHLTSGRELDEFDEGVNLLLEAGLARDWTQAQKMVRQSKKTPSELFWELSKKRKPNWRRRLRFRLIRLFGGLPYDPHLKEMKELRRKRHE